MSNTSSSKQDDRARNWTFVVYPGDSAPENWVEILDQEHLQWIQSPLHDQDMNADGSPKKAHVHVAVFFDGKKSYEQVCEIAQKVNGTVPQRVKDAKAMVRYMAHLDNPEKHQYARQDIVGHGGMNPADFFAPSATERYALIREMMVFVEENDIREFRDLTVYAFENRFEDWFPVLVDHNTLVMQTYITSRRHKAEAARRDVE